MSGSERQTLWPALPLDACRRYLFEECRYEPGAALARALYAFRDAAAPLGLARADLAPGAVGGTAVHTA